MKGDIEFWGLLVVPIPGNRGRGEGEVLLDSDKSSDVRLECCFIYWWKGWNAVMLLVVGQVGQFIIFLSYIEKKRLSIQ